MRLGLDRIDTACGMSQFQGLSVWLVGGFILISVGITGVYIGKIYNEVKRRPLYNIQEIL